MKNYSDRRAKDILFKTYWSGAGWKDRPYTYPNDFEYAKSKGLMFDPVTLSHDECVSEILRLRDLMPRALATRAFLISLSSRRLDWRSGLASYHIANKLAAHQYTPVESGRSFNASGETTHVSYTCGACRDVRGIVGSKEYIREDLNILNFERTKWGGVRHGDLF